MPKYQMVNEKLLQVEISNEEVLAKRGAMMRTVTSENMGLMRATGRGTVLYARNGLHIHLLQLTGETLYIESQSVLAFDNRVRTGTYFQGNSGGVGGLVRGAATGQGLWTTTLEGQGDIAILSLGEVIALPVTSAKPVHVDPNAYIGHKGNLQSQIVTDVGWKTLMGQGSGESFQLKFSGEGTLYVQPSER